jgi:oligoendopeptidase F
MSTLSSPVNFRSLPSTAAGILDWSWDAYAPYYDELAARGLSEDNIDAWLADWTRVSNLLSEQSTRLRNISGADTRDAQNLQRLEAFQQNVLPGVSVAGQKLREKLLESGIELEALRYPMRKIRADAASFRDVNVPLFTEEQRLVNEYNRVTGSMGYEFEGREQTVAELRSLQLDPDRGRREGSWRAIAGLFAEARLELNSIWGELVDLRDTVARNADAANYMDFIWPLKYRFDYTPADCETFHRSTLETVVPALARRHQRQARQLGLDSVRPWDTAADPLKREKLTPFSDVAELESRCAGIFTQLDGELAGQFERMRATQLDLPNRPGKAPGGWCSDYPAAQLPFIFMNTVGVHDDVQTLFHEAGHAFHNFATYPLPYGVQRGAYMEFNEVASMAMELLCAPYLTSDRGGFYSARDAARARIEHLDRILHIWAMVAGGDAFQHWIYKNPQQSRDASAASDKFYETWTRFFPAVDLSGIEEDQRFAWQRTLHYYVVPLYYIEYGIAQLGAVQVWQNSLKDPERALAQYKRGLSLGGTVSLPQLYEAAGIKLAFDADTLGSAVEAVERTIAELTPVAEGE